MDFVERTLRWQRVALGFVVAGSALGFWRGTLDVFNTFKATVVVVGALALVVLSAVRVARTRRILLPRTRAWYALAVFALGLLMATAVSVAPALAVVGRSGRHTGLAMYLVYAVLFVAVLRLYHDRRPTGLVAVMLATAVPVTVYGGMQALGVDPFGWELVEGGPPVFSTFGNANFLAAWLGIVVPLCLWAVLADAWAPWARAAAGALGLGALAVAAASASLQGPAVAVAGSAFVALVWLFTTEGAAHRLRWPLAGASGLAAVGLLVGVLAGAGPLGAVRETAARSLENRVGRWEVALAMAADRPLFGFGLDSFADWYHAYRPVELAVEVGLRRTSDAPHMVPLDMLASGGILLTAGYLAFVGYTAWALGAGLRRRAGGERLLLSGLGGAWIAYQLQSLVSLDVPPLAVLHWLLAGAIVAYGLRPRLHTWTLPGAPPLPTRRPGRRAKARRPPLPLAPANHAVHAGIAVLAVVGLWVATMPLRADAAASRGQQAAATGQQAEAERAFARASRIGFWEARYPALRAGMAAGLGDDEQAIALYEEALDREPRGLSHAINLGRAAMAAGDHVKAEAAYERALRLDPKTPEVLAEVGRYRLEAGAPGRARELLEKVVRLDGDNPEWWVALGEARSAEGDVDGARQAFERALALDPDAEGAAEALETLT